MTISAGCRHLPGVIDIQLLEELSERFPDQVNKVVSVDCDGSEENNHINIYVELASNDCTLQDDISNSINYFLGNTHSVYCSHMIIYFSPGALDQYSRQNDHVARFSLHDDVTHKKLNNNILCTWKPPSSHHNVPEAFIEEEMCSSCFNLQLPKPLSIAGFDILQEWLLDVPNSLQLIHCIKLLCTKMLQATVSVRTLTMWNHSTMPCYSIMINESVLVKNHTK